jgi:hypothetical protein
MCLSACQGISALGVSNTLSPLRSNNLANSNPIALLVDGFLSFRSGWKTRFTNPRLALVLAPGLRNSGFTGTKLKLRNSLEFRSLLVFPFRLLFS